MYWRAITQLYSQRFSFSEEGYLYLFQGSKLSMTHLCFLSFCPRNSGTPRRGRTVMLSRRGFQGYGSYFKSCFLVKLPSSLTLTKNRNAPKQHKKCILKPGIAITPWKSGITITAWKLSHYASIFFHLVEICTEGSTLNVGESVRTWPRTNFFIIVHELI